MDWADILLVRAIQSRLDPLVARTPVDRNGAPVRFDFLSELRDRKTLSKVGLLPENW